MSGWPSRAVRHWLPTRWRWPETGTKRTCFLQFLAAPGVDGALKTADRLQKVAAVQLVALLQRWLYDLFCIKLSGKVRYYPRHQPALQALAAKVEVAALLQALKDLNERKATAEHPLSAKLFIEDMLLDYAQLCS